MSHRVDQNFVRGQWTLTDSHLSRVCERLDSAGGQKISEMIISVGGSQDITPGKEGTTAAADEG